LICASQVIASQIDYDQKLRVSVRVGMAQAYEDAEASWKRVVDGAILAVARRLPEFTVDDVLEDLERIPNAPNTHNLAAQGPRMKAVSKELRYMEAT
jgi:hypothetical protein